MKIVIVLQLIIESIRRSNRTFLHSMILKTHRQGVCFIRSEVTKVFCESRKFEDADFIVHIQIKMVLTQL